MNVILDISILLLFALFIARGFKVGLLRSVLWFLGSILVFLIASYFADVLSEFIYNSWIKSGLTFKVNGILQENISLSLDDKATAVLSGLPSILSGTLGVYGVTPVEIGNVVENSTNDAALAIVDLFSPIIINMLRVFIISVLSIVLFIPVRYLIKIILKFVRIPVLRQLDKILGALFGGAECLLIIFVITFILKSFTLVSWDVPGILSRETINSTILFKSFYNQNIFYNCFFV